MELLVRVRASFQFYLLIVEGEVNARPRIKLRIYCDLSPVLIHILIH